jgi:hypothetical protein
MENPDLRVFQTKVFRKWASKEKLDEEELLDAVEEIERGLVDASLGGSLFKKRVARTGEGKSGGFRTILAYREEERTVFLYCFAKNERENIDKKDLKFLKAICSELLGYSDDELDDAVEAGVLVELETGD